MTNISRAARTHLRNLLLSTAVTLGLAACGGDGSSSSSSAAATNQTGSLVASNTGMINRSSGSSSTASASPSTASSTPSTNSSTNTTTSGSGTVASNDKSTTPVKTTTGSATLDWTPPTENSDGSVLSNLAGYTVYYGTSPTSLTQSVKVTNPGLTAYTVTDLASGTWYFAVTAYSSTGIESGRTATISTTI
jgi:Fibronectin type III domain